MNTPTLISGVAVAPANVLAQAWHRLIHGRSVDLPRPTISRADTHPVMVASAAVLLARCIFDRVADLNVLFVGTSEIIAPYADRFFAQHPQTLTFACSESTHARMLADRLAGELVPVTGLPEHISPYDIVVTCTSRPLPALSKDAIESSVRHRKHRPVLIVDVATGQKVDPEVGQLDDVYLYCAADLARFICENRETVRANCPLNILDRCSLLVGQRN